MVEECESKEQAIEYLGESIGDIFEEQLDELVPRAASLACEARCDHFPELV